MNYIDSLEHLNELLQNNEYVIFVPGIKAGKSVLDWLEYSDNLDSVTCVATIKQMYHFFMGEEAFSEKDIPLLPLECLPHYRESGIFIVAMNPKVHEEIYGILTQFGCKNIFFLSNDTYNQIIEDLKKIMSPEKVMQRFMTNVTKELNYLKMVGAEQNEISAVNSAAFAKYRNAFRGKKLVIVASGPTANYYKPIPDAIHIGINFSWLKENIPLDFLFMVDRFLNDKERELRLEQGFDKIKERIFIGWGVRVWESNRFPVDIFLKKDNISAFYIEYSNPMNKCTQKMYQDICHHPLPIFQSTVFPAIMFALFTYPAELYLVGCDITQSGHFYDKTHTLGGLINGMKIGYARIKAFADLYYPETNIISINPVSLKGLFTDVYTDEYKAALAEKTDG